jgi:hypothetical protein
MSLIYRPEIKVSTFLGMRTETTDLRELGLQPLADGTFAAYSPDQRNWLTLTNGKGIELRRGSSLLGATREEGAGKVTGIGVGMRADGTQVPFFTFARKIKYYLASDNDTHEAGTDTLPAAADGEDTFIFPYQNIAGSFVYVTSKNSGGFKIPVANPGSARAQSITAYRGLMRFGQSRSFLIQRRGTGAGNRDDTSLYVSKVDKVALSLYPSQVTGEDVGTGDGTTVAFSDTLAQITGARTAMHVVITDGTETFTDDRNGNLIGSAGGTGTINYATGAVAFTFAAAPTNLQAITADYYYEDATSGGVADFSISNPSDRQPGEGNIFPQFDGGGPLNAVFPLATVFYCFHEFKIWQVTIPVDDESGEGSIAINLPFRENMGVQSIRGAYGGVDGIYFMNTANRQKPEFYKLELYEGATQANIAAPRPLSALMDFSPFSFAKAAVFEWGDYHLVSCAQIRNGEADGFNSLVFVRNKESGAWDLLEYPASCFAEYDGTLLAGDPLTNNVFTLFSGFDDDGGTIPNYWTCGLSELGIPGLKQFSRFVVEGLIQQSQRYRVQFSFDGGAWLDGPLVDGDESYVDTTGSVAVGTSTVGSKVVGGGATVYARPYRAEFRYWSPKFRYVRVRFLACVPEVGEDGNDVPETEGGGYVSIHSFAFKDVRQKSLRSLPIRTVAPEA